MQKIFKNIIVGFGGQLVIMILGIVIPRILITQYGSDTNGLLSTITQIFTYMSLLEAGIGQASRNALYKPIAKNDRDEIAKMYSISAGYFKRISLIYAAGVILISLVIPFIIKSDVDKTTIFIIVIFEGMSNVIKFYYTESENVLLMADGRGYVNNAINVVDRIMCYVLKIVLALNGMSIAILQISNFFMTVVKAVLYKLYFRKNYPWLKCVPVQKSEKLRDRNSFIITEIAWTIFSSTDLIILSMCISTKLSSVYSIYNLIYSNLSLLLNTVFASVSYIQGQKFHENKEEYKIIHDTLNIVFIAAMTVLVSVSEMLAIPFVKLYTRDVYDVNYIYPILPILFGYVQILSWCRIITGNLTGIAGYAKKVSRISMVEAISNVVLSLILVNSFGIVGVLFATVISLPLKIVYCAYVSDKKILERSFLKTFKIFLSNIVLYTVIVYFSVNFTLSINSYLEFILKGAVVFVICSLVVGLVNMVMNINNIKQALILMRK